MTCTVINWIMLFNNPKIKDIILSCRFLGAGHTADNIIVWFPEEKLLWGGCMLKTLKWKGLGYLKDADVKQWPYTLKKVLEEYHNSKIVIPGHGNYGNLNIVHHTLKLLKNHK